MREREEKDGYDHICTHIDDFKIVAQNPDCWMNKCKEEFLVKSSGPSSHCLGNDCKFDDKQSVWHVGCKTHIAEAVSWVEQVFKTMLKKECSPFPPPANQSWMSPPAQ